MGARQCWLLHNGWWRFDWTGEGDGGSLSSIIGARETKINFKV